MNYIDPASKIFQHPHRLAMLKAGLRPPPISVEVDLSNRCSLGCEYCHFAYTHTRGPLAGKRGKPEGHVDGGDLMPLSLARKIMADLASAGVLAITWAGGGEPTLNPDFNTIIEECNIDQGIYTHGGHINQERADIMRRKMAWCYVSLDYPDAESYKAAKGVDYFDKAIAGTKNLVQAEGKATIGAGFLINKENWQRLTQMIDLGNALGADYIQFRPTIRYDQINPGRLSEDISWMTECISALENVSHNPKVIVDVERFRMYQNWKGHGYSTCYWASLSTVITPNGSVFTCCNTREHAADLLGNLAEESFSDIWNRATTKSVDHNCRLMCRGHIANQSLNRVMGNVSHENFI